MDFSRALACTLLLAACGMAAPAPSSQPYAAPTNHTQRIIENFRHDASLADVYFIDRATGWAVGDRGVIWHTQDSGATWRQQTSSASCRLNSVNFIDALRGWVAGGEFQPHTAASSGVILRTDDGGQSWTPLPNLQLPRLVRVKFFDRNHGIAVGDASAAQPSGVFVTRDGGDTWQPIPADRDGGWLTGDFLDAESGALAGAAGQFAQLARHRIVHPSRDVQSVRSLRALRLLPPTNGWLVGDGGLVLTTNDMGHTWQSPPGDLPTLASSHFDFHAIAAIGPQVWVAGFPGTRIVHSPDNGQTWQSVSTGQTAPIRAITFADADHGWAVGDFGNILATADGGRTWNLQRAGGQRAALLGMFADVADVPLEVIAAIGAADGYLTAIDILHDRPTNDQATDATINERHREALLLAGASTALTAWRFPLPPGDLAHTPAELLAALNQSTDGRAIEQIEQYLVRAIRTWRPDVVITLGTNLQTCEPRSAILAALVMQSVDDAADPTRHADLATSAELEPWRVKKVYELLPPGSHGAESIATDQFSPLLGASLSNFVAPARRLLGPTVMSPRDSYDFDLLTSTVQENGGPRGLFSGISIAAGSEARRPHSALPVNDLDQLRRTAERRHQIESLLKRTEGNAAWVAQVARITEGLNPNDGAELLAQLADGYRETGRLDLAADTYYLLTRRCPEHARASQALEWLIQFYASSEMSHRLASRGSRNVRQALPLSPGEDRGEGALVRQAASTSAPDTAPTIALSRDDRLHRATQLAEYLRTSKPELYSEPRVRFAEVAALRQLGLANPAKRYSLALRQLPETNPWRRCGDTETWLAQPADLPPPKPLSTCRRATERPRLDAQLNEPFWETAARVRLSAAANETKNDQPGEVRLTYDNEYLYIAIRCPKTPRPQPLAPSPRQPRPRDGDLSQHDRVTLRFDIDRDFTTAFELTVDSRGWTHDACWGDTHWDPTWYVAAASDEATWTVEAAVPLAELVETPPAARHVWAVSACRTIPHAGYQTWTGPESDSPERFGFLIFE